jgi:hypothetical protein
MALARLSKEAGRQLTPPFKGRKGWILTMKHDETWGFLMDF